MAVVRFERRALGFEDMVVRVLDFPPGSSGLHDGLHGRVLERRGRRNRMAIPDGAVGLFGEAAVTPLDPQRGFTRAPGNSVGLPIGVYLAKATIPASDGPVLEISRSCSRGNPCVPGWGRLRLTDHDDVHSLAHPHFTHGVFPGEVVTSDGHA